MTTYINTHSNKKRFMWVIALLLAFFGVAGYFYLYPESLPEWAARTSIGQQLQTTTVYKWQDATGNWQVSDQPPPPGTRYRVERYSHDANVLPLPSKLQR